MKMSRMILIAFLCGFVISGGLIVKAVLFEGKPASAIDSATASDSQTPSDTAAAGNDQSTSPNAQASAVDGPASAVSADAATAMAEVSASPSGSSDSASPSPNATKAPAPGTISLAQLMAANGKNGAAAYIAYHGIVYNVAEDPAFINGVHRYNKNIKAGMDLSVLFDTSTPSSHRANDYISRLIPVGPLASASAGSTSRSQNVQIIQSPAPAKSSSAPSNSVLPASTGGRVLTAAQLAASNGQNGAPAYIAYHNTVYDLAGDPAFINGVHRYNKNIKAGMDLSTLFDNSAPSSHRANSYVSRLTPIGVLGTVASGGSQSTLPVQTPVSSSAPKLVLTLSQLTAANGQNGASAYIAYHNNVYDIAGDPAFVNGIHRYNRNIKAGMDLTFLFDRSAPGSHRANDYISRFILIGVMDPSYAGPDPNFILPGGGDDD